MCFVMAAGYDVSKLLVNTGMIWGGGGWNCHSGM